jgi:hypothetical protein
MGRARSSSSVNVPENLPAVGEGVARDEEDEAKWEKRATVLVQSRGGTPSVSPNVEKQNPLGRERERSRSRSISDAGGDVCFCNATMSIRDWRLTQRAGKYSGGNQTS